MTNIETQKIEKKYENDTKVSNQIQQIKAENGSVSLIFGMIDKVFPVLQKKMSSL